MKSSEKLDQLFMALAKCQGQMQNPDRSTQGHGYNYASLSACIEFAKKPMADNGLAVTQLIESDEMNNQVLLTMLGHESGQYIASKMVMVSATLMGGAGKNPAQVLGASITYQRRYAFAGIIGMTQEDDDAKGVQGKKNAPAYAPPQQQIHVNQNPVLEHAGGDKILDDFTGMCNSVGTVDELQAMFGGVYRSLVGDNQMKAKQVYDARKEELETI
jgi:hypothetical protein